MSTSLQAAIRPLQATDVPAVLALLQSVRLPTSDLSDNQRMMMWVSEAQDVHVGVIALERFGSEALLRSLAVAPEHRKRGLGRALVAHLERAARSDGIERLVLLTETAEKLFLFLGYSVIDRRSVSEALRQSAEFRSLCPVSAVCMSKTLQR